MPTLREELEGIAAEIDDYRTAYAPHDSGLSDWASRLRALAARYEPEKPGEALAEVLEKARGALEAFVEEGGKLPAEKFDQTEVLLGMQAFDLRRAAAALSAIEAYRPEPQSEVVRATIERLEMWASMPHAFLFDSGDKAVASLLADHLTSAVPEKPEAAREALDDMREIAESRAQDSAPVATAEMVRSWVAALSAAVPAAPDEGECARALRELLDTVSTFLGWHVGDDGRVDSAWIVPCREIPSGGGYIAAAQAVEAARSALSAHADSGEGAGEDRPTAPDELLRALAEQREAKCPTGGKHLYAIVLDDHCIETIKRLTLKPEANETEARAAATEYRNRLTGEPLAYTPPAGEFIACACCKCGLPAIVSLGWSAAGAPPAPAPSATGEGLRASDGLPEICACGHGRRWHYGSDGECAEPTCGGCAGLEAPAPALDSCPEVAELKEVVRALAREAAREELATWKRDGSEESLFTREDRLFFAACASLQGQRAAESELLLRGGYKANHRETQTACAMLDAQSLLAALAPKPEPAPEEHPAPNTASYGRRP